MIVKFHNQGDLDLVLAHRNNPQNLAHTWRKWLRPHKHCWKSKLLLGAISGRSYLEGSILQFTKHAKAPLFFLENNVSKNYLFVFKSIWLGTTPVMYSKLVSQPSLIKLGILGK